MMKLLTCDKHTIAWHPGDEWHEDRKDMIGVMCPVCASEAFRMKFNELIENLRSEREKIEASDDPCPLCGCDTTHDEWYESHPDDCCIFGDAEYWDRVKEEA